LPHASSPLPPTDPLNSPREFRYKVGWDGTKSLALALGFKELKGLFQGRLTGVVGLLVLARLAVDVVFLACDEAASFGDAGAFLRRQLSMHVSGFAACHFTLLVRRTSLLLRREDQERAELLVAQVRIE
jgi:hypothetical protein